MSIMKINQETNEDNRKGNKKVFYLLNGGQVHV